MKLFLKYIFSVIITAVSLYGCSVSKYIPEDERLYTGATLTVQPDSIVKDKTGLKTELSTVLRRT